MRPFYYFDIADSTYGLELRNEVGGKNGQIPYISYFTALIG